MKTSMTLTELAQTIENQQASKRDYIADTRHLTMESDKVQVGSGDLLVVNNHAHGQIATETGIPKKYYDVMPAELRATNVNYWWRAKPKKRLIRTINGTMRADLSNRFRILDNVDIAEATLPVLFERDDLKVLSCDLTDRRMYIKVGFEKMLRELKAGDVVQSGVIISNSEVGAGAIEVAPYMNRLWCSNGCYVTEYGNRKNHIGQAINSSGENFEVYTDETMKLSNQALMAKLQDTVRACIDEVLFAKIVDKFAETQGIVIDADPVTVVDNATKRFGLSKGEGSSVLQNLINNADLEGQRNTAFGLINAITRTAESVIDYDRATELEKLGGDLINVKASEWTKLAA